jgi:hypothetical protein
MKAREVSELGGGREDGEDQDGNRGSGCGAAERVVGT